MEIISGLKFATSIGVLYELKQMKKHETLQETYKMLETTNMDAMLDVLCVSYNRANKQSLDLPSFIDLLEQTNMGFLKVAEMFQAVVEGLIFSGLTPEEIAERKKLTANLK